MKNVLFGGSRSLSPSFSSLVSSAVSAVLCAGGNISVGCASGADSLVVSAALAFPAPAGSFRLSAVGSSDGTGFWSGSAPLSLLRSVAAAGFPIAWVAGGSPSVPFRARLFRRSLAALAGCAAAVFFLAAPDSSGSLSVAAASASTGARVSVFCCGFSGPPAPLGSGCVGSWVSAAAPVSLPAGCCFFRWVPAQMDLF